MNSLPTILSEIDGIQADMRSAPAAYFRDEEKQARYRDLVAQRDTTEPALTVDDGRALLPIPSYAEYVKEYGSGEGYDFMLKTFRTAADFVFALPASEQRKFVAGIEALPEELGQAMVLEMMSPMPSAVPASDAWLARFKDSDEGAALVREWGAYAARNLARLSARLWRVVHMIDESLAVPFVDWLNSLSPAVAMALFRKLAA